MIWHMRPGLDLYYTDPAQHVSQRQVRMQMICWWIVICPTCALFHKKILPYLALVLHAPREQERRVKEQRELAKKASAGVEGGKDSSKETKTSGGGTVAS